MNASEFDQKTTCMLRHSRLCNQEELTYLFTLKWLV